MTSPPVLNCGGHPHPPPTFPPPPAVPPLVNNQSSLLGDPPIHLLVPQSHPNVLPNQPPNPVYFSNYFHIIDVQVYIIGTCSGYYSLLLE